MEEEEEEEEEEEKEEEEEEEEEEEVASLKVPRPTKTFGASSRAMFASSSPTRGSSTSVRECGGLNVGRAPGTPSRQKEH